MIMFSQNQKTKIMKAKKLQCKIQNLIHLHALTE